MKTVNRAVSPLQIARVLNSLLAVGIAAMIIAYALGSENGTPQYNAILGGALLCFVAAMTILMWEFSRQVRQAKSSLPRSSGWLIAGLMGATGALLVWGTFVDQLKN